MMTRRLQVLNLLQNSAKYQLVQRQQKNSEGIPVFFKDSIDKGEQQIVNAIRWEEIKISKALIHEISDNSAFNEFFKEKL